MACQTFFFFFQEKQATANGIFTHTEGAPYPPQAPPGDPPIPIGEDPDQLA